MMVQIHAMIFHLYVIIILKLASMDVGSAFRIICTRSNARPISPSYQSARAPPTRQFAPHRSLPLFSSVRVYDNVVGEGARRILHELALESARRSRDGSFVFRRGTRRGEELTPVETAIDQILTSLNDTSPLVEYWSRKDYINMDAHADIDEDTLKDEGVLRCPRNGHVLYLRIAGTPSESGDDERATTGPTVVFPGRTVAWGSVTPRTLPSPGAASHNSRANPEERSMQYVVDVENYWDDAQRRRCGCDDRDENEGVEEMTVVPAVEGRLLRFDGAAFHAVPRPPDRYLLTEPELAAYLEREKEEEDCDDEDEYWDDDHWWDEYDEDEEGETGGEGDRANLRSVLLFNTWPEGSAGPKGVVADRVACDVPDGISIEGDGDGGAGGDNSLEDERWRRWQDVCGSNFERVRCNPLNEWEAAEIHRTRSTAARNVTVPLMGNPARRGVSSNRASLKGHVENHFFSESRRVSTMVLERIK